MSNSSASPIDRALSSATTLGQSEPGSNSNERVLRIPKAPTSLEPCHQIVEGVLPLCRDIFYNNGNNIYS